MLAVVLTNVIVMAVMYKTMKDLLWKDVYGGYKTVQCLI